MTLVRAEHAFLDDPPGLPQPGHAFLQLREVGGEESSALLHMRAVHDLADLLEAHPGTLGQQNHRDTVPLLLRVTALPAPSTRRKEHPDLLPVPQHMCCDAVFGCQIADGEFAAQFPS